MPLYEYQCEACGHRFEVIRKFSDEPLDKCPKCGGGPVQKLQSAPAFHLKGSGWYASDYGKKDVGGTDKTEKPAAKTSTDATAASSSDSPSTSTSESKPAAVSKPAAESTSKPSTTTKDS